MDRARAGPPHRRVPAGGRRHATLEDAINSWRPADLSGVADWPHKGSRARIEMASSIRCSGRNFFTWRELWMSSGGLHPESSSAWEHRVLLTVLGLLLCFDQLDGTNIAGIELAARRVIMIEKAVKVNPESPSFVGLSKMIEHSFDEGGASPPNNPHNTWQPWPRQTPAS